MDKKVNPCLLILSVYTPFGVNRTLKATRCFALVKLHTYYICYSLNQRVIQPFSGPLTGILPWGAENLQGPLLRRCSLKTLVLDLLKVFDLVLHYMITSM